MKVSLIFFVISLEFIQVIVALRVRGSGTNSRRRIESLGTKTKSSEVIMKHIQLFDYSNPNDIDAYGEKCDNALGQYKKCDPYFVVQYKGGNSTILVTYRNDHWENVNHISFNHEQAVNLSVYLGEAITVSISAYDADVDNDDLIGRFTFTHHAYRNNNEMQRSFGGRGAVIRVKFETIIITTPTSAPRTSAPTTETKTPTTTTKTTVATTTSTASPELKSSTITATVDSTGTTTGPTTTEVSTTETSTTTDTPRPSTSPEPTVSADSTAKTEPSTLPETTGTTSEATVSTDALIPDTSAEPTTLADTASEGSSEPTSAACPVPFCQNWNYLEQVDEFSCNFGLHAQGEVSNEIKNCPFWARQMPWYSYRFDIAEDNVNGGYAESKCRPRPNLATNPSSVKNSARAVMRTHSAKFESCQFSKVSFWVYFNDIPQPSETLPVEDRYYLTVAWYVHDKNISIIPDFNPIWGHKAWHYNDIELGKWTTVTSDIFVIPSNTSVIIAFIASHNDNCSSNIRAIRVDSINTALGSPLPCGTTSTAVPTSMITTLTSTTPATTAPTTSITQETTKVTAIVTTSPTIIATSTP